MSEQRYFYEYELKILDLRANDTVKNNRIVLSKSGTIELSVRSDFKSAIMLAHAKDFVDLTTTYGDEVFNLTIEIKNVRNWPIDRKEKKD